MITSRRELCATDSAQHYCGNKEMFVDQIHQRYARRRGLSSAGTQEWQVVQIHAQASRGCTLTARAPSADSTSEGTFSPPFDSMNLILYSNMVPHVANILGLSAIVWSAAVSSKNLQVQSSADQCLLSVRPRKDHRKAKLRQRFACNCVDTSLLTFAAGLAEVCVLFAPLVLPAS
jgi:hypothetical protein